VNFQRIRLVGYACSLPLSRIRFGDLAMPPDSPWTIIFHAAILLPFLINRQLLTSFVFAFPYLVPNSPVRVQSFRWLI
jgi:hypothetical protein